ncbi:unnamed protein product [Timema podura]|uniref:Uncharacterized protein n=1 Tax=Timema podura TaxID=61482 RepID=A0ABN7PFL4_TIMPD|nr:unnamed protein product [Timema podura]
MNAGAFNKNIKCAARDISLSDELTLAMSKCLTLALTFSASVEVKVIMSVSRRVSEFPANGKLNHLAEMDSQNKDAQVFMVVVKLIEAAADKEETVREAVTTSLRKLSKKHPNEVLRHTVDYRKRNAKASSSSPAR